MQSYNTNAPRNSTKSPGIDSKVSVKAGKIPASGDASPIDAGNKGAATKGFKGGLINPKIKC